LVDVLLFIVEVRVVDTRGASDEDVDIAGDESFGAISRISGLQLKRLAEEHKNSEQRTHSHHQAHIHPGKGAAVESSAQCTLV
jgi:hypothetical protein